MTSAGACRPSADVVAVRVKQLMAERFHIPEHDKMARCVVDAMATVSARLDCISSADAQALLLKTIDAFFAFRVTFAKTAVPVYRIAFVRRMFESLDAMLKDLDQVVKLAGLSKEGTEDEVTQGYQTWRATLANARDTEEAEFAILAKRSTMPFARNAKGHEAMEALTLMKFEIDLFPPPRNTKKHVASMKAVFFSIVRSSNGRVTKIPDWFSPPYMIVREDPTPLTSTGLGTSIRGRWADRHHDGAVVDVVSKRLEVDSEGIELFRHDVETWTSNRSPHVMKLSAASHCSSLSLLGLEDAKLGTLREYVKTGGGRHRLEVFVKAREVALGLKRMRAKRHTVHLTLKSFGVRFGANGISVVTDFGGGIMTWWSSVAQHTTAHVLMKRSAAKFQSCRTRPSFRGGVAALVLRVVDAVATFFRASTAITEQPHIDKQSATEDECGNKSTSTSTTTNEYVAGHTRTLQVLRSNCRACGHLNRIDYTFCGNCGCLLTKSGV